MVAVLLVVFVIGGWFEAPFDGVGVGDFAAVGGGCGEGVVALLEEGMRKVEVQPAPRMRRSTCCIF